MADRQAQAESVFAAAGGEKQVVVHGCHKVTNNQAIGANAKESVVCNNSTAMIGNLTGEIVFALDVSASMKNSCGASLCPNGSKIRELQLAATNVINKYEAYKKENNYERIYSCGFRNNRARSI